MLHFNAGGQQGGQQGRQGGGEPREGGLGGHSFARGTLNMGEALQVGVSLVDSRVEVRDMEAQTFLPSSVNILLY